MTTEMCVIFLSLSFQGRGLSRLFDFSGLQAFGADISRDNPAFGVDDPDFMDIGLKRPLGTARDLTACAAFDPGHTAPGRMSADDAAFFANYAYF
jgi:hypothetical protein